jgi:hypothetical protein
MPTVLEFLGLLDQQLAHAMHRLDILLLDGYM